MNARSTELEQAALEAVLKPISAPLCGIYAVALATGRDWQSVFDDARLKFGRSERWKGRMFFSEMLELLDHYGLDRRSVPGMAPLTLENAAAQMPSDEIHLICVTGHIVLLHGGRIFDQHFPLGERITDYRWRRRRVKRWVQITPPTRSERP